MRDPRTLPEHITETRTDAALASDRGQRVKTSIKAGVTSEDPDLVPGHSTLNHGLRVKTSIKAGAIDDDPDLVPGQHTRNHGLRVKTSVANPSRR